MILIQSNLSSATHLPNNPKLAPGALFEKRVSGAWGACRVAYPLDGRI